MNRTRVIISAALMATIATTAFAYKETNYVRGGQTFFTCKDGNKGSGSWESDIVFTACLDKGGCVSGKTVVDTILKVCHEGGY